MTDFAGHTYVVAKLSPRSGKVMYSERVRGHDAAVALARRWRLEGHEVRVLRRRR